MVAVDDQVTITLCFEVLKLDIIPVKTALCISVLTPQAGNK